MTQWLPHYPRWGPDKFYILPTKNPVIWILPAKNPVSWTDGYFQNQQDEQASLLQFQIFQFFLTEYDFGNWQKINRSARGTHTRTGMFLVKSS